MNEPKKRTSDHRQKSTSASQQKNSTNAARQISTNERQQTSTNAARQKATKNYRQNSTIASRQKTTRSSTESRRKLRLILSILLVLAAFWLGRQDFLKTIFPPAGETQGTKVVELSAIDVEEQGTKAGAEQAAKEVVEQRQESLDKPGDEKQAVQKSTVQDPADLESEDPRSPEFVASVLRKIGKLPDRFLSKKEARKLGWVPEQGNLNEVAPGKSIGGDRFGNYEGKLPAQKGRSYREADVHDSPERRGAERLVFSNDGLIFYTPDHYKTFYDVSESFPGKKLP